MKKTAMKDVINILLSRIKLIIIITVIFTVGAFCIAKLALAPEYTSSIKIFVKNSIVNIGGTDINYSGLAGSYIEILDDNTVYEYVSQRLIEEYDIDDLKIYFDVQQDEDLNYYISPLEIRDMVSLSAVNNTEVIQISCTSEVPGFSASICDYIMEYAPDLLKRVTQANSVESVSDAEVPDVPSGPNVKLVTLLGLIVGLAASAVLVFIINNIDNKVKNGEDIKARFDIPILAEIPDIYMDEKGAGKHDRE